MFKFKENMVGPILASLSNLRLQMIEESNDIQNLVVSFLCDPVLMNRLQEKKKEQNEATLEANL